MESDKNIKQNPFRVPESYFEELPSKIQQRVDSRDSKPSRDVIGMLHNPALRVAASLFLIIGIAFVMFLLFNNEKDVDTSFTMQEDHSVVQEYLLQDIDNSELFQAYMEMTAGTDNGYLLTSESPEEQEVIDYLLEDGLIEYYLVNDI